MKHARKDPELKKLKEGIEKKERKRQTIRDVLSVAFVILLAVSVSNFLYIGKNEPKKTSQTETFTSMQEY